MQFLFFAIVVFVLVFPIKLLQIIARRLFAQPVSLFWSAAVVSIFYVASLALTFLSSLLFSMNLWAEIVLLCSLQFGLLLLLIYMLLAAPSLKRAAAVTGLHICGGIICTLVFVIVVRLFLFSPFVVSGEAMSPGYVTGDYLVINLLQEKYQPGDVVVYKYPRDPSKFFIHRIVAVPGDQVRIEGGILYINGEPESGYFHTAMDKSTNLEERLGRDEYFLMGDNRDRSSDSRIFGVVQRKFIQGTPVKFGF